MGESLTPLARRVLEETFVAAVEHSTELPSTNDRALELAGSARVTPLLIVADRQSAGRGRGANRWFATDGSLTFSLLLDRATLPFGAEHLSRLSLLTGLAIADALEQFQPTAELGLKWPNDIFLGGRKVCGILCEVSPQTGDLIIGVGINVTNDLSNAPPEVRRRSTSLGEHRAMPPAPDELLVQVLTTIGKDLQADNPSPLVERWERRCMLRTRSVEVRVGDETTRGVCHGIDEDGALLLWTGMQMERCIGGVVSEW